jgi:hypothetical protein
MSDTSKFEGQCETPMSDHVARFWQLVREFEVRIVVDQMTAGFGGKGFYATSIFSNDTAKAILSTNEKLTAENARLREALDAADSALHEAEAVLGGEYGDHYGPLCEKILKLRSQLAALNQPQE